LNSRSGRKAAEPLASDTDTGLLMTNNCLHFPWIRVPTSLSMFTKGWALPSMIGTSWASTSTVALSTPMPLKADKRCSTVETVTPSTPIVVASVVSQTFSRSAFIRGRPGRSRRMKVMPASTSAGRIVIPTFLPVWRPMLRQLISFLRVLCRYISSLSQVFLQTVFRADIEQYPYLVNQYRYRKIFPSISRISQMQPRSASIRTPMLCQ